MLLEDSKKEIEDNKNQLLIETKKLTENNATSDEIYLKTTELNNNITEAYKKLELAEKINKEVQKMKYGSIAIINQIRVISKQRIYYGGDLNGSNSKRIRKNKKRRS